MGTNASAAILKNHLMFIFILIFIIYFHLSIYTLRHKLYEKLKKQPATIKVETWYIPRSLQLKI
jgi:hypothetical protein